MQYILLYFLLLAEFSFIDPHCNTTELSLDLWEQCLDTQLDWGHIQIKQSLNITSALEGTPTT